MKKQPNHRELLLFIFFFAVTVVVALAIKTLYIPRKIYHSDFLKISIDYPSNYQLEEKFGTITLKKNAPNKKIIITNTGTNYNSIKEYLNSTDETNKAIREIVRKNIIINGWDGVESVVKYKNNPSLNHKSYIFYKDYGIYSLFTTSPDLYNDLDQIAKSFRYAPAISD